MQKLITRFQYAFLYKYDKERIVKILLSFFAILGFTSTLVEFLSWIFDGEQFVIDLRTFIRNYLIMGLVITTLISLYIHRRKIRIQKTFTNTDISIVVEFCDLFEQKGATVINVMDTFDTDITNNLVNANTIHGQFISKYFSTNVNSLNNEIGTDLVALGLTPEETNQSLKGKKDRYKIGTVCRITTHDKYFYLAALTFMQETGNIDIQPQYIYDFLSALWDFIPNHGVHHETINIPLIATGINRLPASYAHQFILREIANSFFLASKQSSFCKTLKICLNIKDYKYYDFEEVSLIFTHIDKYLNR